MELVRERIILGIVRVEKTLDGLASILVVLARVELFLRLCVLLGGGDLGGCLSSLLGLCFVLCSLLLALLELGLGDLS